MPRKPIVVNTNDNPDNSPPIPDDGRPVPPTPGPYTSSYSPYRQEPQLPAYNPTGDLKTINDQWKHRRRMAYVCLAGFMLVTVYALGLMPEPRMKAAEYIINGFFFGCISIIGAYMGFATWASFKNK